MLFCFIILWITSSFRFKAKQQLEESMRFKISPKLAGIPLALFAGQMFATQAIAASTEWNVSLWGKPRAFAAHVEKLAELVYEKTKGDFELNLHFGGLSKNKEKLKKRNGK